MNNQGRDMEKEIEKWEGIIAQLVEKKKPEVKEKVIRASQRLLS